MAIGGHLEFHASQEFSYVHHRLSDSANCSENFDTFLNIVPQNFPRTDITPLTTRVKKLYAYSSSFTCFKINIINIVDVGW